MFPYSREETSINDEYYLNNDQVTIEIPEKIVLWSMSAVIGTVDTLPQILWNETVKVSEECIAMR